MSAEYHARKATPENRHAPVSKSLLWEFSQSPYKWAHKEPSPPTAAMRLGTVAHLMVLEPDKVADEVRVSPFDSFRTKEAREWRAEQEEAGKIVMTSQEGEILEGVVSASCLAIADCLQGGEYDVEVEVTAVFNGVELCGLIDLVGPEGDTLWDLKTTSTIGDERSLQRLVYDRGYDVQAAIYTDLFAYHNDRQDNPPAFGFIFVETCAPYEATWIKLSERSLQCGRARYMPMVERWKALRDVPLGELPGGVTKGTVIDPPAWIRVED